MIFLIGGAPRTGKSTLCQQLSTNLKIGWTSTDLLMETLRSKNVEGTKFEWNASPKAITSSADWFFPCLERYARGVNSLTKNYIIEGVDFLPKHVTQLGTQYPIRSVFLGCSNMTLERFDNFPGHSRGYANQSEKMRRQFAEDIPRWSKFIQQESERFGCPYFDTGNDFQLSLKKAGDMLINT